VVRGSIVANGQAKRANTRPVVSRDMLVTASSQAVSAELVQRWLMHSVLWASILASAGVAVITTLLVEYLAKPGLEARKDRILESKRNDRSAVNDLKRIVFLAALMARLGKYDRVNPLHKRAVLYAEETERLIVELGKNTSSERAPLGFSRAIRAGYLHVTGVILSKAIELQYKEQIQAKGSDSESWDELRDAYMKLSAYCYLLTTPRWKYRKRSKLIHEIATLIDSDKRL
jgi:hypothetical protein